MDRQREQLAALAHEQWSGWMRYLFGRSQANADGTVTLPADLVGRWQRQLSTPYADLSEGEKDSDRIEADKVLALLAVLHPIRQVSLVCGPGAVFYRWDEDAGEITLWIGNAITDLEVATAHRAEVLPGHRTFVIRTLNALTQVSS